VIKWVPGYLLKGPPFKIWEGNKLGAISEFSQVTTFKFEREYLLNGSTCRKSGKNLDELQPLPRFYRAKRSVARYCHDRLSVCPSVTLVNCRAGLRHVRGVQPNRAAKFRGPQFWTLQKLNCQLWPLYSLILFGNSLKLVPPDVRF